MHDFWRITFYPDSGQFLKCVRKWVAPKELLNLVLRYGRNPFLRIEGGTNADEDRVLNAGEEKCLASFYEAGAVWQASRQGVSDILKTYQGLNRNVYSSSRVARTIDELDGYFLFKYLLPEPEALQYVCFDPPRSSALKKDSAPPSHEFFDQCAALRKELVELDACYQEKLAEVRRELIRFIQRESSSRKRERNTGCLN